MFPLNFDLSLSRTLRIRLFRYIVKMQLMIHHTSVTLLFAVKGRAFKAGSMFEYNSNAFVFFTILMNT